MTLLLPEAFPQDGDSDKEKIKKGWDLVSMEKGIVGGPELRLTGAKILHSFGRISDKELSVYIEDEAQSCYDK